MWDHLFDRQTRLLPGRVAPEFLDGLKRLDLTRPGVPDFARLNDELMALTGWQVVAVPGLVLVLALPRQDVREPGDDPARAA